MDIGSADMLNKPRENCLAAIPQILEYLKARALEFRSRDTVSGAGFREKLYFANQDNDAPGTKIRIVPGDKIRHSPAKILYRCRDSDEYTDQGQNDYHRRGGVSGV